MTYYKNIIIKLLNLVLCYCLFTSCSKNDMDDTPLCFVGDSHIANWDVEYSFPNRITKNYGVDGRSIRDLIDFQIEYNHKKKKKKMIDLLFGVLCIILSISTVLYYTYVTTHPQIKYFEGSYDGLNHYRTYGETEYSFKDNEGITEFI